jgi:hypothetical protein
MSLNESIVEEAALEWFGEQCRFARTLTRSLPRGEEAEREAIRHSAAAGPTIPEESRATIRQFRRVQMERSENP